jgi:hypothetical protein
MYLSNAYTANRPDLTGCGDVREKRKLLSTPVRKRIKNNPIEQLYDYVRNRIAYQYFRALFCTAAVLTQDNIVEREHLKFGRTAVLNVIPSNLEEP